MPFITPGHAALKKQTKLHSWDINLELLSPLLFEQYLTRSSLLLVSQSKAPCFSALIVRGRWGYSPNKATHSSWSVTHQVVWWLQCCRLSPPGLLLAASVLLFKAQFLRIRPFTEQSEIKGYREVTFFQFGKPLLLVCWIICDPN